jgi:hypothetical protein
MKINLLLLACTAVVLSCAPKKNASAILEKSGIRCDQDLGDYRLKYPAVKAMPYENKTRAVFRDSLGRRDTFAISFVSRRSSRQSHNLYPAPGDTLRYCYLTEYYHCMLESPTSKLQFKISVAATPRCLYEQRACIDADAKTPLDALRISYCNTAQTPDRYHYGIFYKVLGAPTGSGNRSYPNLTLWGKTFSAVESTESGTAKRPAANDASTLFYTVSDGIVAFSIGKGPLWRLEGLE